jgi:hypothetical protein
VLEALVYAKKPVGAVMMRPIVERLRAVADVRVYGCARWFGRRNTHGLFAAAGLPDVTTCPKWLARFRAFDLYLSADFGVVAPRARVKVHTFHGVSFRNHAINAAALRYDLLLIAGPYMRRRFEELGLLTAQNEARFAMVGMPKLDALVDGRYRRDEVLARLDLDPARKTVLYAPTWSKKFSSLESHGSALIEALRDLPWNVIVKLHDNALDPRKASRDWKAAFAAAGGERMRFVEWPDVVPLMTAADVMVSDASSAAYEFALLDRPIVFLETEGMRDKLKPKADLETWGQKVGAVAASPAHLRATIERELADPGRLTELRHALTSDLFFEPGRAADNAVRAILAAL